MQSALTSSALLIFGPRRKIRRLQHSTSGRPGVETRKQDPEGMLTQFATWLIAKISGRCLQPRETRFASSEDKTTLVTHQAKGTTTVTNPFFTSHGYLGTVTMVNTKSSRLMSPPPFSSNSNAVFIHIGLEATRSNGLQNVSISVHRSFLFIFFSMDADFLLAPRRESPSRKAT